MEARFVLLLAEVLTTAPPAGLAGAELVRQRALNASDAALTDAQMAKSVTPAQDNALPPSQSATHVSTIGNADLVEHATASAQAYVFACLAALVVLLAQEPRLAWTTLIQATKFVSHRELLAASMRIQRTAPIPATSAIQPVVEEHLSASSEYASNV